MQRIPRSRALEYGFNRETPPALYVHPDELFVVETEDAATGRLRSADSPNTPEHRPELRATPPRTNPVGGPIHVAGAEPGDVLAVHVARVDVDGQGWTGTRRGIGPLGDSATWAEAAAAGTHILHHVPGPSGTLRDGHVVYNERFSWPLEPFIGTIGTAPEREVESTLIGQGPWGGNLDCRDIAQGATVLLNCYCPGGLLLVGDVHGSQSDTEFTGTANETRAEVTLRCSVVKGAQVPFVRVVTPDSIIALACARPLEEAVHQAVLNLMGWMVAEYGVSRREAYLLMSVCPAMRVHVYQMVKVGRIGFTVGAEFPLALLAGGS